MRGGREVWSKGIALGLAEIAEKERRAFSYGLFASGLAHLGSNFNTIKFTIR